MDLQTDWHTIRKHFNTCFRTNFHVSVASVDTENKPTVTPIGSMFLKRDQTAFYFEKYPTKLPQAAKTNKHICVLAVNSGIFFWVKSLFKGRFSSHPGIKLYGELGDRRQATEIEISRLQKRMRQSKGMKGNKYLWGDMQYVREIRFTKAEKLIIGKMTEHL
jgi:hypothetical protein